jgi:hypothetical protein
MILTKEQIDGLKNDINFQMACVVDVAGKKRIKIKDLYDTIVYLMNKGAEEQ